MPIVVATPRRMGRDVITELTDSVGTSEVTYTLQEAQDTLKIHNLAADNLLVSVGTQSNVEVPGYKETILTERFTDFRIKAKTTQGSFRASASYKDVDEDDEKDIYSEINNNGGKITLLPPSKVMYAAHRGVEAMAPENSLKSFELAAWYGFDYIETDTSPTSDGVWVIMHDDTVDRMTNGIGSVVNLTLAQIQSFAIDGGNYASWYKNLKVPTLEEVLKLCRKYNLTPIIEVKNYVNDTNLSNLINLIITSGFEHSCSLLSPYNTALKIRALNKNINTGTFYSTAANFMDIVKKLKPNVFVAVDKAIITKDIVDLYHKENVKVNVYALLNTDNKQTYLDMNVDYITGGVTGD